MPASVRRLGCNNFDDATVDNRHAELPAAADALSNCLLERPTASRRSSVQRASPPPNTISDFSGHACSSFERACAVAETDDAAADGTFLFSSDSGLMARVILVA
jgi:hypothetical protein